MDKDIQISLIVSIPPTLMALATLVIGLKNSKKLTQVHKLANSNLKRVTVSLKQANEKIEALQKLISNVSKKGRK